MPLSHARRSARTEWLVMESEYFDSFDERLSVLRVSPDVDLPLQYAYFPQDKMFRTLGFVRIDGAMCFGAELSGPDTVFQRDLFLARVLTELRIPPRRAVRIVKRALHIPLQWGGSPVDADPAPAPRSSDDLAPSLAAPFGARATPSAGTSEGDGSHLIWLGVLAGMLCGALVGFSLAGANGAVIGAFVGMSTLPDLVVGVWQALNRRSGRSYVLVQETMAVLLVASGALVGAAVGYLLGGEDFRGALGVFLGMALAAFSLSAVAAVFSMAPFWGRAPTWFGPLIVGGTCWCAYALWSSPVALALGVVLGSVLASVPLRAVAGAR